MIYIDVSYSAMILESFYSFRTSYRFLYWDSRFILLLIPYPLFSFQFGWWYLRNWFYLGFIKSIYLCLYTPYMNEIYLLLSDLLHWPPTLSAIPVTLPFGISSTTIKHVISGKLQPNVQAPQNVQKLINMATKLCANTTAKIVWTPLSNLSQQ